MAWKSTYANRGSGLEELVSMTTVQYRSRRIARIDKVATPIKPLKKERGIVTGYMEKKSTVDYVGTIMGGMSVAFDCKETTQVSLPLQNIEKHQIEYLEDVHRMGGYAFLVVYFKRSNKYYRLDFDTLKSYWDGAERGGRKSIPEEAFEVEVKQENKFLIHFLKGLV